MMEDQQLPQSQDSRDTIVRKMTTEEEEEGFVSIKEEMVPLQVTQDPVDAVVRNVKIEEEETILVKIKEEDTAVQVSLDPGNSIVRNVKTEEEVCVKNINKDTSLQIGSDGRYTRLNAEKRPAVSSDGSEGMDMDMLEEKLIECVRHHPELYDTSNPKYLKTKFKQELWMKIAEELNHNLEEVKNCWSKLRGKHRDALRRQRRACRSGTAAKPCKPWKFQSHMQFLLAFMVNENRETNFNVEDEEVHALPEMSSQDLESHNQSCTAASVEAIKTSSSIEAAQDESMQSPAGALTRIVALPSAARPKKNTKSGPVEDIPLKHLEASNQRAEQRVKKRKNTGDDSHMMFFQLMAEQTRNMHPAYLRELKKRIFSLVSEFEEMYHTNYAPSSTAQVHQLQPMSAHSVPEFNFPRQAEASFSPPFHPLPSTSTEGEEEQITSSMLSPY